MEVTNMSAESKTPMSDLIDRTIYEMMLEERAGITTEYTILIRQIVSLYNSLYNSSGKENKDKDEIEDMHKAISQRANIYMKKTNDHSIKDLSLNINNKNNLLSFKCYELVNRDVNVKKLQESLRNN